MPAIIDLIFIIVICGRGIRTKSDLQEMNQFSGRLTDGMKISAKAIKWYSAISAIFNGGGVKAEDGIHYSTGSCGKMEYF